MVSFLEKLIKLAFYIALACKVAQIKAKELICSIYYMNDMQDSSMKTDKDKEKHG